MIKRFTAFLASLSVLLVVGLPQVVGAAGLDPFNAACQGSASSQSAVCKDSKNATQNPISQGLGDVARTLAYIGGIAAIITFLIAGRRIAHSSGDTTKVAEARRWIVYALLGLVVSIMALAIDKFLIQKLL